MQPLGCLINQDLECQLFFDEKVHMTGDPSDIITEVTKMQVTGAVPGISWWKFLYSNTREAVVVNRNVHFQFQPQEIHRNFPNYDNILIVKLHKALNRKNAIQLSYDRLGVMLGKQAMPEMVWEKIWYYLSNEKLNCWF